MSKGVRGAHRFGPASRRDALVAGLGLVAALTVRASTASAEGEVAAAISDFTRNAAVEDGGMTLRLPPIVEDGDQARLSVGVDIAGDVRRLGIFSSGNPLPVVALYRFGEAASPRISTNIRLWRTQTVTAVAEFADGTFRSSSADVSVTLAACRTE